MSIYIQGMEMPKVSGRMEAVITILKDGTAQIAISPSDDQIGYWKEYPLVPVQPHGALIDRDALLDTATIHWSQTTNESCFPIDEIEHAPIVIPAEP